MALQIRFRLVLSLALLALPAIAAHAQAPQWAGWARCQVTITGPGYNDTQTHTWTITGGAPTAEGAFTVYGGTWSVVGGGSLQRTQGNQSLLAQWARTVSGVSAPIAVFVRPSDRRMFIQARHAQLRAAGSVNGFQQVTIDGTPQPPGTIAGEAFEWAFPAIEVTATPTSLTASGTSAPPVTGSVGLMQPAGSQGTASCSWQFAEGAPAPAPPPTLVAQAIPTPPVPGGP